MSEYHDDPESPDEINPAYIAPSNIVCELLLKDPSVAQINEDGSHTELMPDAKWLTWAPVPVIADPENCRHTFSVCSECADSWGEDHYIRFWMDGHMIWRSPDHPDGPIEPDQHTPLP